MKICVSVRKNIRFSMLGVTQRRLSSLVGRIKLNESVSPVVVSEFANLPSTMDRIEIFDNSIGNDPSPPCKAAAVLLRSSLVLPTGRIPCVTVLKQKVFDYNNRDFQKYQLQNLVDQIAADWLTENGGGLQLTVHRRSVQFPHSNSNTIADETIFAKSTEIGSHRNLSVSPATYFRFQPFAPTATRLEATEPLDDPVIAGLEAASTTYTDGTNLVSIASIDRVRRRMTAFTSDVVHLTTFSPLVQSILRKHFCLELVLFAPHMDQSSPTCDSLVVNYKQINVDVMPTVGGDRLLSPQFIA